jgi:hypothetical protein
VNEPIDRGICYASAALTGMQLIWEVSTGPVFLAEQFLSLVLGNNFQAAVLRSHTSYVSVLEKVEHPLIFMPSWRIRDVFLKEQCQGSKIKYILVIILYLYHNLSRVTYAVLMLPLCLRQFPCFVLCLSWTIAPYKLCVHMFVLFLLLAAWLLIQHFNKE